MILRVVNKKTFRRAGVSVPIRNRYLSNTIYRVAHTPIISTELPLFYDSVYSGTFRKKILTSVQGGKDLKF